MSLYKSCGRWKNFDCIFEFSVKSYVRNTINLSYAKIVFHSVIIPPVLLHLLSGLLWWTMWVSNARHLDLSDSYNWIQNLHLLGEGSRRDLTMIVCKVPVSHWLSNLVSPTSVPILGHESPSALCTMFSVQMYDENMTLWIHVCLCVQIKFLNIM